MGLSYYCAEMGWAKEKKKKKEVVFGTGSGARRGSAGKF